MFRCLQGMARGKKAARRSQARRRAASQAFHLGEDPLEGLEPELRSPQEREAADKAPRSSSLKGAVWSGKL